MCDEDAWHADVGIRRSTLLAGAAVLALGMTSGTGARRSARSVAALAAPVIVADQLAILPRDAWGADLPPRGPLFAETTKFLLVHHTASSSNYASARDVIRGTYSFHTSRAKGWPDVCYEFFVGRDGDVWEGRAGALSGPVVADATGGSQGYAQLVCLLGDFSITPPSSAALESTACVLAWLSRRDGIDITPGAMTTFESRGSDKWRAGTLVTAATISGHRDMTYTACPGDGLYQLLPAVRERAVAIRERWDAAQAVTPAPDPMTPGTVAPEPNPDGLRPARRLAVIEHP